LRLTGRQGFAAAREVPWRESRVREVGRVLVRIAGQSM
jgi:hypothetical protein